ncbi:hypothetical protein TGPRC2_223010 [Toxoplasma gondii TgCatPRC2]|uniref:Uncharacterized protein n=15 Tax=Toxoplasma gondii TaxID=5811 RepID=B9PYY6_TOXGV|nr:hypothetical protein TGME49_223010 [Toxoplasma gondii ME49]EPR58451.1 hypothetical protein TGGT1_223010 [Toxoplasma gondii GT1]ESS30009.1 hypothetical protein TGVEG_223010 [Toxoplasma gondii VEG]KAF4645686.1 hypothetical protein TGRH88_001720 [Toxoplasma gondii]KFG35927.1 hypothetical protein TGP89_223010 [Toxoplasma gondii p89]KFG41778.1 hypothetical protein TGDOM2_223010 [Toxoplasma gondii GAB2-2007-GAL-DOM2]KFG47967.1 hypothetical protein TGFOU_223010 [Toxoplasma gondii FOU]KFG61230.1 |eukprot:XP_002370088.1 hypothetical protein TGME49_223010 [Toxoplasma gondii ME49]
MGSRGIVVKCSLLVDVVSSAFLERQNIGPRWVLVNSLNLFCRRKSMTTPHSCRMVPIAPRVTSEKENSVTVFWSPSQFCQEHGDVSRVVCVSLDFCVHMHVLQYSMLLPDVMNALHPTRVCGFECIQGSLLNLRNCRVISALL